MNIFVQFFNVVLYQPLLNALVLLYLYLPGQDLGLAVIALTLLIKLLLHPSTRKSLQSQQAMSALQPKVKEVRQKYKDDRQKQTMELMQVYKQAKVSPASGCLPLLIQLPILIALYRVFINGLKLENLQASLYSFVPFPGQLKTTFLGILDLSRPFISKLDSGTTVYYWPVLVLALIASVVQFIQSKKFTPQIAGSGFSEKQGLKSRAKKPSQAPDFSHAMQKQMLYFLPLLTIFIIVQFGSIIGLYWLTSSLFTIGENYFIGKSKIQNPNNKPISRPK